MKCLTRLIYFFAVICEIAKCTTDQNTKQQKQIVDPTKEGEKKVRQCEIINAEICRDVGYDTTGMPNQLGHQDTKDALEQLKTFTPLFQVGCEGLDSTIQRIFFCSAYLPLCTEKHLQPVGPCRPLCEVVQEKCEKILIKFGFVWPIGLNCSRFHPVNEEDHMCINPYDDGSKANKDSPSRPTPSQQTIPQKGVNPIPSGHEAPCQHFHNLDSFVLLNSTRSCVLRCDGDAAFTKDQKKMAEIWLLLCSVVSFVLSFVTVLTYLIESSRFAYPERTVFLVAFCNLIACVSYFIRLTAGREAVACLMFNPHVEVLVQSGLENINCTVSFILTYYFTMAALVWWVILCLTWALLVGKVVTRERLGNYSAVYHGISWTLPAIPSIIVLILRSADADELNGMCLVGNWNKTHLLTFIIAPICLFLSLGVVSLIVGAIALYRSKRSDRTLLDQNDPQENGGTNYVSGIPSRMLTVFAIIYSVCLAWVLGIACYEYSSKDSWYQSESGNEVNPPVVLLHVKTFCRLVVGVICFATICNKSTVLSWMGSCRLALRRCETKKCGKETSQQDKTMVTLINKSPTVNKQNSATTSFTRRNDSTTSSRTHLKLSNSGSVASRTDISGSIYRPVPHNSAVLYPSSRTSISDGGQSCVYLDSRRMSPELQNHVFTVS